MKHSFVVGKTYQDHICAYKVVSIDGDRLVYKAADGIHEGSAEAKWRIYSNILSGQSAPHTSRSLKRPQSAIGAEFFTYEEVAAIFADVIKAYDKSHNDFMTHEKIIAAFMEHPEGQLILNRPHDRTNLYWVGVMKAHFSRKYNSGKSEWDDYFELRAQENRFGLGLPGTSKQELVSDHRRTTCQPKIRATCSGSCSNA